MAGAKCVGPDQWTDRSIGSDGENRGPTRRQEQPVNWTLCLHRIKGALTITELPIHLLAERKGRLADLQTVDAPATSSCAEKRDSEVPGVSIVNTPIPFAGSLVDGRHPITTDASR